MSGAPSSPNDNLESIIKNLMEDSFEEFVELDTVVSSSLAGLPSYRDISTSSD